MRWIIPLLLVLAATTAVAQFTNPAIGPGSIGRIGPSQSSSSSVTPPPSCTGTIDLSTGCVQPMLGGL